VDGSEHVRDALIADGLNETWPEEHPGNGPDEHGPPHPRCRPDSGSTPPGDGGTLPAGTGWRQRGDGAAGPAAHAARVDVARAQGVSQKVGLVAQG
jgi:hypothetical protein